MTTRVQGAKKTYLVRYQRVVDVDNYELTIPLSVINKLYDNINACFPEKPEKSPKHYYLRLIDYLHHDMKRVSARSSSAMHKSSTVTPASSMLSSSEMEEAGVIVEPAYGFTFVPELSPLEYAKKNRWELFVLFEGHPSNNVIAGSCLVHYDEISGIVEIEEVCVSIPGKKYCNQMITKVMKHIKKEALVHSITIYCENENIPACKCYHSIFDGLPNVQVTQKMHKGKQVTTFIYNFRNFRNSRNSRLSNRSHSRGIGITKSSELQK